MTRINIKNFKEALKKSGGNQTIIATKLEVTRQAVSIYLIKNPKMKELCEIEGEKIIDAAENIIDSSINNDKDIDSAKWKLLNSKRGKNRGYGPKTEIEHQGESNVVFNLIEKSVEEIKSDKLTNKPKTSGDAKSPK